MKIKFKIIREEQEEFEKVLNELFGKGWFMEGDTYRIFEYTGRLFYSIMMSLEIKEKKN